MVKPTQKQPLPDGGISEGRGLPQPSGNWPGAFTAKVPVTFLGKQKQELDVVKDQIVEIQKRMNDELRAVQLKGQQLQENIAWLELHPEAEAIFQRLIEKEIADRDRNDLASLLSKGSANAKEGLSTGSV